MPSDQRSSDSGEGENPSTIGGFVPLVLALPAVIGPASPLDPFIMPKPISGISRVSGLRALEAILLSPVVINPKTFSIAPNLQTQEGVTIRMQKPFPYEDSGNTMCP